ncbi:hypothetical protein GobsT_06710 [Gemmata obscuriglobus]|uniref:Carboxypeptidase regulatory-like domain-containing protein n=1 Tax=Gemmata obscuriglobus TaxID=114 RepID=A0A2Z3H453_9BACT|nr:carboxypeptidase regulatory-like domain-containing protein [Gemmata obscuriglobus]AWM40783.1 carboxypeptidase regulatory-like domain-containing protein [Gemmata obscuriglobus]QEG25936.1 hypothetical protein GobsT_06710 [Gemmata obscuriglobus]VTS00089.1 hypothetical protein : : CarboxypepD_reg [Gemmata obscuriglobus UQM 2246]
MSLARQLLFFVALLAPVAAGCGGSESAVATSLLRGKVTCDGRPVVAGVVTAYRGGTKVMEANINPDGGYEFARPSAGEYQLTVTKTDVATPYAKPVKLPARYADPAQSGLTAKVAGDQASTQDLALTAK